MSWEPEDTAGGFGLDNDGYGGSGGGHNAYGGNGGGANPGACFNCGEEGYAEVHTLDDERLANMAIATWNQTVQTHVFPVRTVGRVIIVERPGRYL